MFKLIKLPPLNIPSFHPFQTLQARAEPQLDNEDAIEFFKDFESARVDVFEWIRDEFRSGKQPSRLQRDLDAVNGDTWYKNYQIKECEGSNKSSFCNGQHVNGAKASDAPEISELFDELDKPSKVNDDEKLQEMPTHDDQRINDKNMKLEHLLPVSDHRSLPASNYNPSNVEARFSATQFLAKQQNAIHEIELKHQHLVASSDDQAAPKTVNENQLRAGASSNSNFPSHSTSIHHRPTRNVRRVSSRSSRSRATTINSTRRKMIYSTKSTRSCRGASSPG